MSNFKISPSVRRLTNIALWAMCKRYNISASISDELKNINEPYLLLSNHIGSYDPFILSFFIKKPLHYVSSDAVLKDPKIAFFFNKLGVIPKKKNTRDTQVIRDIISVVKAGGAVGLFPEGTRSWTGKSFTFDPSIGKLIKLLGIPVITARMKGMHLCHPRWAFSMRKTKVHIEYNMAFSKAAIQNMTSQALYKQLKKEIAHDEVAYQQQALSPILSDKKAEFIDFVLFWCSQCDSIGQLVSKGNTLSCQACKHEIRVNPYSFFEGNNLPYDNIRDAFEWQRQVFEQYIEQHWQQNSETSLFEDEGMEIFLEEADEMKSLGLAKLYFFLDRIEAHFESNEKLTFWIKDIDVINPQFKERIEVNYQQKNYRFTNSNRIVSGLKWEIATTYIWHKIGQEAKTSLYLKV